MQEYVKVAVIMIFVMPGKYNQLFKKRKDMSNKNRYIIKGDLSGIQDFIFDVPSKGAAKELKQRSLYISNLSIEIEKDHASFFEADAFKVIYNGGGNLFYDIKTSKNKTEITNFLLKSTTPYIKRAIYPYFAIVEYSSSFQQAMQDVNRQMLHEKQKRLLFLETFKERNKVALPYLKNGQGVNYHYPKKNQEIMDFDAISEEGTGDNKLAALKIDIDHLGRIFRNRSEEEYHILSKELTHFFDHGLLSILQKGDLRNQIYVVFSGGDDCFLIGTWSSIVDLAAQIHLEFNLLNKKLKKEVSDLAQDITFSAGITIFPPKYPMQQMAEEVEDCLLQAKNEGRNKITILGYALTWEEYGKVLQIKNQLHDLVVDKGESKSLIQRIKSSNIGYEFLQKRAEQGKVEFPKVWSLKYYLRNVKRGNKEEVEKLFDTYAQSLIDAFMNKENTSNPMIFPIAARLTELLIKN